MDSRLDVDHPERDQDWNHAARSETEAQRLDRNWNNLLQELRVTQTGVQLLTGFLLTLPFQNRFATLGPNLQGVYLATVVCSLAATTLLVAPVGIHRALFRRHRLKTVVSVTHRFAYAGLLLLGLALTGVGVVVFGAVLGGTAAAVAGVVTGGVMAAAWVVYPGLLRGFGTADARESRRHVAPQSRAAHAGGGVHQPGRRGPAPAGPRR